MDIELLVSSISAFFLLLYLGYSIAYPEKF